VSVLGRVTLLAGGSCVANRRATVRGTRLATVSGLYLAQVAGGSRLFDPLGADPYRGEKLTMAAGYADTKGGKDATA
jgi:hypothetical protein